MTRQKYALAGALRACASVAARPTALRRHATGRVQARTGADAAAKGHREADEGEGGDKDLRRAEPEGVRLERAQAVARQLEAHLEEEEEHAELAQVAQVCWVVKRAARGAAAALARCAGSRITESGKSAPLT